MSGLLENNFYSNFVEKLLNTCWSALVTWQGTWPIPVMCPLRLCENCLNVASYIKLRFILILKPDCDPLLCGNYWIIALINSDHKIFAMVLTKLLRNKKSTHYISTSQVVFLKNRFWKCLNAVCNIIHLANKRNSPAADDLIEAEKAFDWIEWDYSVHT